MTKTSRTALLFSTALALGQPGVQKQGAPGAPRPGLQNRPAQPRRPAAPPKGKPAPKERR